MKNAGWEGFSRLNPYGTKAYKASEIINSIEVGDIVLTAGRGAGADDGYSHIGIIIGIDSSNVYVAEEKSGRIRMTTLSKSDIPGSLRFVPCNKIYTAKNPDGTEDKGNITNMW